MGLSRVRFKINGFVWRDSMHRLFGVAPTKNFHLCFQNTIPRSLLDSRSWATKRLGAQFWTAGGSPGIRLWYELFLFLTIVKLRAIPRVLLQLVK